MAFYLENLAAARSGLSVAFDLPPTAVYDRFASSSGTSKRGSIVSVEDMNNPFDQIHLIEMSVSNDNEWGGYYQFRFLYRSAG